MKRRLNWKTTLFGVSAILGGAALIVKGNPAEGVTSILSGFGLLFAKDHDNAGLS